VDTATAALGWIPHQGPLLYVAIFMVATIDAMGVPIPGRLLLIAAGAVLAQDWSQAAGLVAGAALGALAGDHVWYTMGRMGGDRLLGVYCKLSLTSGRCEQRARATFERYGPWAIIVGRFFAGIRIAAAPMLGTLPYARYLLFEVVGAVVWASVFVLLGYGLGAQWRMLLDRYGIGTALAMLGGLVLLALAAVVAVRLARRRRHGRAGPEGRRRSASQTRRLAAAGRARR
jgi:membrane protein DedA with SNARE-associated domain